jgi:hypothetical protein
MSVLPISPGGLVPTEVTQAERGNTKALVGASNLFIGLCVVFSYSFQLREIQF